MSTTPPAKKKAAKKKVEVQADALTSLMTLLQPVIDAQTRAGELSTDDMHVYFHVRVYRGDEGEGEMIADLRANNSLAGVFDKAHLRMAPQHHREDTHDEHSDADRCEGAGLCEYSRDRRSA